MNNNSSNLNNKVGIMVLMMVYNLNNKVGIMVLMMVSMMINIYPLPYII
jgi:hypothetical protein